MNKFIVTIGIAIAAAAAWPVAAQTGVMAGSAPGKAGVAQTVKVTATITAIDKATRDVTLKGPQGTEVTLRGGEGVALRVTDDSIVSGTWQLTGPVVRLRATARPDGRVEVVALEATEGRITVTRP